MSTSINDDLLQIEEYKLQNPNSFDTPSLLIFEDMLSYNLEEIIKICKSPKNIVPHIKTHKSLDILKLQIASGITSFKCATLKEAELLANSNSGVQEIIISYPIIHIQKIIRLIKLMKDFPNIKWRTIVSTKEHLETLSNFMKNSSLQADVYMDLDTGMHRTGVEPGDEAVKFFIDAKNYSSINILGIHIFDGQTLYKPNIEERSSLVKKSIEYMRYIKNELTKKNITITDNVVGGSWSFHLYLNEPNTRVSPGTWIYWDSRNATQEELNFKIASVVIGQVIDIDYKRDTITTDIGSKSISPDQPIDVRLKLIGKDKAELIAQSEEHGVIKLNGESLDVGDLILAAPGHACTTTILYPHSNLIDKKGNFIKKIPHEARDR